MQTDHKGCINKKQKKNKLTALPYINGSVATCTVA